MGKTRVILAPHPTIRAPHPYTRENRGRTRTLEINMAATRGREFFGSIFL